MSLPTLPDGYHFDISVIDGPRVRVAIESATEVAITDFVDAGDINDEPTLTATVEASATAIADTFIRARNLQEWVDTNWPSPAP